MQIVLIDEVENLGIAGDIREVKDGFARNYLIPQGLAVQATEHELRRAAKLRQQADNRRLQEASEWQEVADALKEEKVRIEVRTGPTGRLYGSVTNTMIAAQLAIMTGRDIDRKGIQIPAPIRAIGDYKIPARLVEGVNATLRVEVVADETSIELNKQLEEVSALIVEEDQNILDPSFEDVLAAAEANIDAEASGESEESEASDSSDDDDTESDSEAPEDSEESAAEETAEKSE